MRDGGIRCIRGVFLGRGTFITMLVAFAAMGWVAPALAQTGTCGTPAGFEIDGDLLSGGGDDWALGAGGNAVFLGPTRTVNLSPAISFRDPHWAGSAADASSFGGTSNKNNDYIGGFSPDSAYTSASGSGPQKDDFTDIYIYSKSEFLPGPPAATNLWLFVGGTTRAVNGDDHVDFEFNRAGVRLIPGGTDLLHGDGPVGGRSIGDVIVSADFGIGGTTPSISIRRWQEVSPGVYDYVDVTPTTAGSHFMCIDTTPGGATGPWGGIAPDGDPIAAGDPMVPLQFFEGAVNLTLAGVEPGDFCSGTSTLTVKSRSSDSFTAELKDYALVPFSIVTPPTCSVSGLDGACANTPGLVYTASTNAGSPVYTWTVTGNATLASGQGTASITVDATGAGTFTVHVDITDAVGACGTSCEKTVDVFANPTVTVNSPAVCQGASTTLTATPSPAGSYTYAWSNGETTSSISVSTAGTYSVTVTDGNGCTGTGSGTLIVNPNPTVAVNSPAVCQGASATLTATPNPPGAYTYAWSSGGTGSSISVSTAGTYSVTITDGNGCTGTGSGTLTVNPNPTVTVNSESVCQGGSKTLTATPNPAGSYTYAWSTGETTSSISVNTAGTYSVTITDGNGCTGTGSGVLTLYANPTVAVNSPAACQGASATLTATPNPAGSYTYAWSTGETTSSISVSTAGTYSVTITDENGCTGTGSGALTVNPNPTVAVNSDAVCQGASATLTATPNPAGSYTYAWSNGETTSSISVSTAGTYSVTITDGNGCTGTGSGTLTLYDNPTVTVNSESVCQGGSATLTATPNPAGSYTYAWSTGETTSSISVSTAGTYSVTVTDGNGCPGTGSGTLTVNPDPDVIATGDELTCFKTCGQVSASSTTPSVTYGWTGPNGFSSTEQNPAVCDSGTYTVTVTSSFGCTNTASAHVGITIPTIAPCGSGGPVTSGFELEGDAVAEGADPPDDWDLFISGTGGSTLTTGIVDDFPSKADDYFKIGTKDITDVTEWRYGVQSTPDKDDILHGGAAQYGGLLYFFGDRYDVSGDAQIGFWFVKDTVDVVVPGSTFSGHHSVGDLLVLSNFVKGGGSPVIFAYEWVGSGGSDGPLNKLTLSSSNSFATVNSTSKPSPWAFQAKGKVPANTFPPGAFFEGGIDLGCLTGQGVSGCFSNFILETRSSASVTASLKDFLIGHFSADRTANVATVLKRGNEGQLMAEAPHSAAAPTQFALMRAMPNPFSGSTVISYALPEASRVSLRVFNVLGQQVATLVSGAVDPGFHTISWNARGRAGQPMPAGVYFYRLEATGLKTGEFRQQTHKLLLAK